MNQRYVLANAILWAAAIIAAAIVKAPTVLTLVLLPTLAAMALVLVRTPCRKSADRALRNLVTASSR